MLTFNKKLKDTYPIAKVKGIAKNKKLNDKKIYLIRRDVYDNSSDDEENDKLVEEKDAEEFRELQLVQGYLQQLPDPFCDRTTHYIGGVAGSGKSTYASGLIREYKKMYPSRRVILFSRKPNDPVLDQLNPMRVKMDFSLVDEPVQLEELTESMVIFDDVGTIADSSIKSAVFHLINDILEVGRSYKISCIVSNHLFCNYKDTRTVLNESQYVTAFPHHGGKNHFKRYLKAYLGLDEKQIKKIMKVPSRWVTLHVHSPMYVMYNGGIYFLE